VQKILNVQVMTNANFTVLSQCSLKYVMFMSSDLSFVFMVFGKVSGKHCTNFV